MFSRGLHRRFVSGIDMTRDPDPGIIRKDASKPAFCEV
jgi:hypothetical protein